MKQILSLAGILLCLQLHAQPLPLPGKKTPKITVKKGWSLSVNPLAPFELLHTAIGAGVGYTFTNNWQVWTEINFLTGALTSTTGASKDLKGIRTIFALKRFSGPRGFFYGIEGRHKFFSFTDKDDFINKATGDTLRNVANTAQHTVFGAAVFWGRRVPLSPEGKWQLELSMGFGGRYSAITRKNIPATYERRLLARSTAIASPDSEGAMVYFPCAARIIYQF